MIIERAPLVRFQADRADTLDDQGGVRARWQTSAMTFDDPYARVMLAIQRFVLSREQARQWGITSHGLEHRLRPGGPWQRVLPGVYLTETGEPTEPQLHMAALLYAGPESVITGLSALRVHGIRGPSTEIVDVLIPAERKRADAGHVRVHRTRRMPPRHATDRMLRYALPARAVADAVRTLSDLADARTVVASAVQQRRCWISQLVEEVQTRHGGDALLRRVLADVATGVRSAAEGDLYDLLSRSDLPTPLYNAELFLDGQFLARPDAWWPKFGVAVEVESKEWHLLPADWEHTMARQRRMTAAGIYVLQFSPGQLRRQPTVVLADVAAALKVGRPLPAITTRAAA